MISRFFWTIIALLFPWLVLLLDNNPGGALVALIMQATIIGWFPATLWALRVVRGNASKKK